MAAGERLLHCLPALEAVMTVKDFLLADMNREIERSRWALERVPEGKYDWKPHYKSMIFGYLANMVATIPMWITAILKQDSLDIAPQDGSSMKPVRMNTSAEYLRALDQAAEGARAAFASVDDEFLRTPWQLKAGGKVVQEGPRDETIIDTIQHWAHHRGQMTVYLRLMGAPVPAIYGPSADDSHFR
jgi:uncharacterized damage-inducible protein DinB